MGTMNIVCSRQVAKDSLGQHIPVHEAEFVDADDMTTGASAVSTVTTLWPTGFPEGTTLVTLTPTADVNVVFGDAAVDADSTTGWRIPAGTSRDFEAGDAQYLSAKEV